MPKSRSARNYKAACEQVSRKGLPSDCSRETEWEKQNQTWESLADLMGYPDSWVRTIKRNLLAQGKQWKWTDSEIPKPEDVPVSPEILPLARKAVLLIIGPSTSARNLRNTLLSSARSSTISVVYLGKPPLLDGTELENEIDSEFTRQIELGRGKLSLAEEESADLGLQIHTSFIWGNSISEFLKEQKKRNRVFDVVINVSDIPSEISPGSDQDGNVGVSSSFQEELLVK